MRLSMTSCGAASLVRQLPWVHAADLSAYVTDLEERVRRHRARGAGC